MTKTIGVDPIYASSRRRHGQHRLPPCRGFTLAIHRNPDAAGIEDGERKPPALATTVRRRGTLKSKWSSPTTGITTATTHVARCRRHRDQGILFDPISSFFMFYEFKKLYIVIANCGCFACFKIQCSLYVFKFILGDDETCLCKFIYSRRYETTACRIC
jgi:hypothetical protein